MAWFDCSSPAAQETLAAILHTAGTPRCLARWLSHMVKSTAPSPRLHTSRDLSDEHVRAIVLALPQVEPAQLLVQRSWGFGGAAPFLWMHRAQLGPAAAALLAGDALQAKSASVALRLLGFCAHESLLEAARKWGLHAGEAQATALLVPLLAEQSCWRGELEKLALDPLADASTKLAAYAAYIVSGDAGDVLLERIAETSPELMKRCRFMTACAFVTRPSLFTLGHLLDHLHEAEDEPAVLGGSLLRASDFADGPHALAVARRLLPLLQPGAPSRSVPALSALMMLRQPVALHGCLHLMRTESSKSIRELAATVALACRPKDLPDVADALDVLRHKPWWRATMAARLGNHASIPGLIDIASNTEERWWVRRRALLSLERLPRPSHLESVIRRILSEQTPLGL